MKISRLLLIIAVIIVLAVIVFLFGQKTPTYAPSVTSGTKIESTSDLNTTGNNLDQENLDSLDSGLNEIDSNSSSF